MIVRRAPWLLTLTLTPDPDPWLLTPGSLHAVAGHAHIKTGSLEGVRSLAGYVFDARGRRMAVVAIVNHPRAGAARPALDALLQWVYQRP